MPKPIYALGLGCERGCDPQEVLSLAERVLKEAQVAASDLVGVFSIDQRQDEPAIVQTAEQLGLPVTCFNAQILEKETPRLLNPSERVFALIGCHGVAEAAALVAVGSDGVLLIGKTKSAHATAALAVKE
ncbi:cobalamin biosynthesis protein [Phyllobacterium zundukense]|uniref:Precorrin methylase n=1 Tax=Phyllobacterium zundukense TaxID=1867719 RepID=A0A2N9W2A3_9HYPH|nr:cobalamin biosynthesis protein [Phyllobacterium zundukense]ATU91161.1 precorrin methylase [Phyllobacterium zundukense]PIO45871.1 precorrin methylase [Phyllobacterium zundukense]